MNCPACNHGGTVSLRLRRKEYELHRCPACDLMFWHPMKAPGPELYQAWPVDFATIRPVWSPHTAPRKFFRDMPARGGKLLDVGCGVGDFCYLAAKAGYTVTGIDFAPWFIEVARQRFPTLDLEPLSLQEFVRERGDAKYDVVTFIQVLEHLDDVRGFLQAVREVLRPGGYAVCAVPNRERWRFLPQLLREDWDFPPNHFTWWNRDCLQRLFDSFGFTVLSVEIDAITPFDCSFLLSEKLHLKQVAEWFGRRLVGNSAKADGTAHGTDTRKASVARFGYRFYNRVVLPLYGVMTLPVLPLLRREGGSIYLLAQRKDA